MTEGKLCITDRRGCMKRLVYKYRTNKFKRFTEGLLFAVITMIALSLCLTAILNHTAQEEIILPFCMAIISMLMGIVAMFGRSEIPKEKI
jgi:hypothetical protein